MISKLNKTVDYAADTGMVTVLFSSVRDTESLIAFVFLALLWKTNRLTWFSNPVMTFIMLKILLHKSPFVFVQLYMPFLMFSRLIPAFLLL